MKMKKRTIVWFILAAFFCYGVFFSINSGKDDKSESKFPKWEDAVYVEDAQVLPENEGKLVAISGPLETIEGAVDEQVGVSFDSPYVSRTVQVLHWDKANRNFRWEYVDEVKSDDGWEGGYLTGRIKIGEFELDDELIGRLSLTQRDMTKEDFTEEEIAAMEEKGYVSMETNLYFSEAPRDEVKRFKESSYLLLPDWDGAHAVSWKIWEPKLEEGLTVVGIQKGDTLTYCELDTLSVKHEIMDKDAFEAEGTSETSLSTTIIFAVLAIFFAVMGVRSILNNKKTTT